MKENLDSTVSCLKVDLLDLHDVNSLPYTQSCQAALAPKHQGPTTDWYL